MKNFLKKIVIAILTWEAKMVLSRFKPKIIAITGSVGKTGTKDALFTALSSYFKARKSEKSFNSELGVPLTILGCSTGWGSALRWSEVLIRGLFSVFWNSGYPNLLILEVGADRPGDIKKITRWLKPHITVITRFGEVPVHIESFRSREELIDEKRNLVRALRQGGTLILNSDDEDSLSFKKGFPVRSINYGVGDKAEVRGTHYKITYSAEEKMKVPTGVSFRADFGGNSLPVNILGAIGKQQMYPVLVAFAVTLALRLNPVRVAESFTEHVSPPGRMRIIKGVEGSTIIDDTYNASPVALMEALATFSELEVGGKKIAVLGDMLELGKYSKKEHEKAGKVVAEFADMLIAVGERGNFIAESAILNGMLSEAVFMVADSVIAGLKLKEALSFGDAVLVKGSQGMRMEKTVLAVMAHSEDSGKLLVRQEREWR